ncbi:type VII secretion integral membrane protein EccD [Streptomyces sp. SL13]|uniref:Type VII secretion integral membrane protein EccD n=1 Tax=Streptantibioticus silvisoli TaxID=2705255 RepID=A0AA90H6K5_9ACTN|nr:type VII secretion integral membrane protein EccD [Streptantibioticus silvisoli]MDI5972861.1 type VII secretion integral membrane protein EccD [Streptantibioticus silvisoli]
MTTAYAAADSGPRVCRITVVGPEGRADLAVPAGTPLSALMPVLVRHVAPGPAEPGTPWVLQRLGEDPLDPDGTPDSTGLRHGDLLYLRPAPAVLPALQFDDISDGVALTVGALPGRWRPALTRGLALALAVVALVALAAALLGAGPGARSAVPAAVAALVLGAGCVAAARAGANRGAAVTAGLGCLGFAALVGLTFRHGPGGGYAPGLPGLLVAAGCVVVCAVALLALRALPPEIPGTALLTAVAAGIATGLMTVAGWHGGQAATVVAVAMFAGGHFGPRLTLRLARLRVPLLPRDAEELQRDIEPEPQERVERRVRIATLCLDVISLSSAFVYVAGVWFMTHADGWIGWVLPLLFCAAVLLRSRALTGTLQRLPLVVAGAVGLVTLLLVRLAPDGPDARIAVTAVLLAAVGGLLVAAWRLPSGRLLPVWGQSGDTLEMVTAIALLPLLLQALHTYAYFRSLAG